MFALSPSQQMCVASMALEEGVVRRVQCPPMDREQRSLCFTISANGVELLLSAESEGEYLSWLTSLKKCMLVTDLSAQ